MFLSLLDIRALGAGARRSLSCLLVFGLLTSFGPVASAQGPAAVDAAILGAVLANGTSEAEQKELRALYQDGGGRLLWATPERRFALVKMLVGLELDGINIAWLGELPGTGNSYAAQDDVVATRAVLRAAHLVSGNSTAGAGIPGWHITRPAIDVVAVITAAAREDRLGTFLNDLRPTGAAYQRLQAAYMRYHRLATEPWPKIDVSGARIVETGDERMSEVVRRLTLLGDITETAPTPAIVEDGIRRFQTRHGLDTDGRVGPATLEQLNISPQARARQIAVNLGYWRLLPRTWPTRYLAVNTAAAHLDVMRDGLVSFSTRAIIGDRDHATPVIAANITAVTFNPPWTVPYSIATKEMLPRLRRDSSYLARNSIEIVGRAQDPHGQEIDWRLYTRNNFPFQLRQIPGSANALGLVKFEMPNRFDVYLHDTPNRSLFDKSARALSHGCVRVQGAQELAEYLIDDPSVWTNTNYVSALRENQTFRVPLKQDLPVYLLYFTAFFDEAGAINFRPDIYGRDSALARLLSAGSLVKAP